MHARVPLNPALVAAAAAAALLAAGCSSSGTGTAQAQPSSQAAASLSTCRAPEPATLPHASGSLTEADSGVFCLGLGQTLDVFLTAPAQSAPGTHWDHISADNTSVVGYGNSGVLTPPLGVTPGVFVGTHPGVATLSSVLLPAGKTWKVTLVVK